MKKTEAQGHFSMTRRAVLGTVSMTGLALAMPGFATEAKAGGTFIWGKAAEPKSLDPAVINDADSSLVTRIIYDGLTRFKTGTTEVEPALAESWDVSEDGLTITFKIRQGVKFHDGTPLDAKAIEMNFERWSDPSSALRPDTAQSGNNFSNWSSYMIQDPDAPLFNSAEAVDPQTFVLQLNRPFAAVLNTLATFPFGIVSPRMLTERPNEINENPVGTGRSSFHAGSAVQIWFWNATETPGRVPRFWINSSSEPFPTAARVSCN